MRDRVSFKKKLELRQKGRRCEILAEAKVWLQWRLLARHVACPRKCLSIIVHGDDGYAPSPATPTLAIAYCILFLTRLIFTDVWNAHVAVELVNGPHSGTTRNESRGQERTSILYQAFEYAITAISNVTRLPDIQTATNQIYCQSRMQPPSTMHTTTQRK